MSPETEETLLHHVPRRAPASLLLSGVGPGATSMHKVAPGLASLSDGRGCSELLIRDIHAHPWLGIWGAPCPDPATRRSCCSCRCHPVQLAEPPALAVVCSSFQLRN